MGYQRLVEIFDHDSGMEEIYEGEFEWERSWGHCMSFENRLLCPLL